MKNEMLYEGPSDFNEFLNLTKGAPCKITIEPLEGEKLRTAKQNKSIHKYCSDLSTAYNEAGLDMQVVLEKQAAIPWSMQRVKDNQWRQIQLALGFPESTTKLETHEVTKVYEVLNRHTAINFGISVAFPSLESLMFEQVYCD